MKTSFFNFARKTKVLFAISLAVLSLGFMSCQHETDDDNDDISTLTYLTSCMGTWRSTYGEIFKFNTSEVESYFETSLGYTGDSVVFERETATSGYIYMQYTRAYCTTHSSGYNYIYDTDSLDVGKWYAIYYKNLTLDSVSISGSALPASNSLEDAKIEHTVEKGAFAGFSECTRIGF